MGSATYYMKARFADEAAAEKAVESLRALVREGAKAADFWQSHRGDYPAFWSEFGEQFPTVSKYLRTIPAAQSHFGKSEPGEGGTLFGGDHNNALAGVLDFGEEDDAESVEQRGDDPRIVGYYAEVWHLASWDEFMRFIEAEYGAIKTGWVSDEYVDVADSVVV